MPFTPRLRPQRSIAPLKRAFLVASLLLASMMNVLGASPWEPLAPGLAFARFPFPNTHTPKDSSLMVLRIDPAKWKLRTSSVSLRGDSLGYSTRAWAKQEGFTAVINAGLYDTDRSTHVGLMVHGKESNNSRLHGSYKAVFAYDPIRKGLPGARTFDLDVTPLKQIRQQYRGMVQNLRLIKKRGENRWTQPGRAWWSEAALAEDREGNILFLYTPAVVSMHDFNKILLALPLHVVSAQHLEGGQQAQLYIKAGEKRYEFHSGYEVHFNHAGTPTPGRPIPNVIGISPR